MTPDHEQPAQDADDTPEAIHLTLRPLNTVIWKDIPVARRLARVLKGLLRQHGFRCDAPRWIYPEEQEPKT